MLISIHRGGGAGARRDGAGVPGQADHVLRAVRGRERDRYPRALAGAGGHRRDQAERRHRQPARCERLHRHAGGRQGRARRLRRAHRHQHNARSERAPVQEDPLRPGEGLRARHRDRARRSGHGREPPSTGEDREGIHRARQAPAGQAHVRQRQLLEPRCERAVPADGGTQDGSCSL